MGIEEYLNTAIDEFNKKGESDPKLQKGPVQNPDIRVLGSSETFDLLWKKELRPMKALALRKIQVKASLEDMLRLRKFF